MASTSSWAALYFVALMTFGNYVLFNLLVAILVEGFQAEVRGTSRRREPNPLGGIAAQTDTERPLSFTHLVCLALRHTIFCVSPASQSGAPQWGAWHRGLPPEGRLICASALRGTG